MKNKKQISIIGAGNMGTTLANVIAGNGYIVKMWDINPKVIQQINKSHENKIYLPGVKLLSAISATEDIMEAVGFSDVLILTIPSQYLRSTLKLIPSSALDHEIIVNCAKGIELKTMKFMTEVIHDALGKGSHGIVADLSGPSIANELAQKKLTAVTIAAKNKKILNRLKKIFNNNYFRIQTSQDVLGVELGGVIKNIYSIGIGMCDVISGSMNTRALLLTRALEEMCLLGCQLGTKKQTFYGLSGIGDLIATCLSEHSRNRRLGQLIAKGKTITQAQKIIKQVTEGYYAAKAIHILAKKHKVKLLLAENIYQILYHKKDPQKVLLRGL